MRSGARQTSVLRVGTCAGPSRRTHRSGTSDTSPGGGLSIPFPHARMNPTNIDATPLAQSERERSSATYGGFTSNRLVAPRKCTPCLPLQCGGTRRDARIRCASPMHALDQHLPKQMYLPHSSISAQRLPSLRTRRTRRPTSSIHIAAASGSSSRATAHDGSPSRKESPSVINAIRQLDVTDSVLSSVCRVLWNTPGGGLAIGFT